MNRRLATAAAVAEPLSGLDELAASPDGQRGYDVNRYESNPGDCHRRSVGRDST